jgi:CTP synthase (UTP-ammonia lyase)
LPRDSMRPMPTAKLALVGDRSPSVRAHGRIPLLIEALRRRDGLVLDPYWIPSPEADDLHDFDGIWVVPGSPYSDPDKVVDAVKTARLNDIPFLGTCGGFQHAILHLAKDLAGIEDAHHAEYGATPTDRDTRVWPPGPHSKPNEPAGRGSAVIVELECSLVGHEGPIAYTPGTLIGRIAGVDRSLERYHCSYGIATEYIETLQDAGVIFGAHDQDGAPRALELDDHPFFIGTLFQPELAGDGTRAHPVIRAFAEATALRARERSGRASQPA